MHTQIYLLRFSKESSDRPLVYRLVKDYDLEFSILKADILLQREGMMILEIKGAKESVKAGLDYLRGCGVRAQRLTSRIRRDDSKCFQCGECAGICPSGALSISRPSMAVVFDAERCTGCDLCVPICPVRAMEIIPDRDMALAEDLA
ncbi:MAG TPA: (Fe-S)-binding protein [Desulfobulbaceae bacterium]|nr:(Fe-S)-binding protein [Desulfobulbaceae bacterium]